jgi:hypothetical protein
MHVTGITYWPLNSWLLYYNRQHYHHHHHHHHHHRCVKSICCSIFIVLSLNIRNICLINVTFYVFILTRKRKLCHIFRTLCPMQAHARIHNNVACVPSLYTHRYTIYLVLSLWLLSFRRYLYLTNIIWDIIKTDEPLASLISWTIDLSIQNDMFIIKTHKM